MKMYSLLLGIFIVSLLNSTAQVYYLPFDNDITELVSSHNPVIGGDGISFFNSDTVRKMVLDLDGDNSYLILPDNILRDLSEVTIACWFKYSGGEDFQSIYNFGYSSDGTDTVSLIFLTPKNATEEGELQFSFGESLQGWHDVTVKPIKLNVWYFSALVGANPDTDSSMTFYLKEFTTEDDRIDTVVTAPFGFDFSSLYTANGNYIGKSLWNNQTFHGMIDDFRIYDQRLSETEIQELYEAPLYIKNNFEREIPFYIYSANNRIFISKQKDYKKINTEVYNVLGSQVFYTEDLNSFSHQYFEPGIYIIQLNCDEGTFSKKVVVR